MKKQYLVWLSLFFIACADNDAELQQENNLPQPTTRAIVDSTHASITNPELFNNWENLEEVVLNSSSPTYLQTVTLPWISGSITNLPPSMTEPMRKDDGWTMLLHTFKNYGIDRYQNYMIMYNKITGIFRVYYYNEVFSDKNNNFMWVIRSMNNLPSYFLENLTYPTKDLTTPPTSKEIYVSNFSSEDFSSLGYGWNGFEINISYSQGFINQNFSISAINKNISNISLEGISKGSIDGKIITTNYSENKLINGAADIAGGAAKKFIDSRLNNDKVHLSKKIINAISKIPTTGYIGAIKGGLNLIFGSILGSKKQLTEQEVKLSINTNITMQGTESFPSIANIAPINNIKLSQYFGSEHIGTWTLSKKPKVILDRYSVAELYEDRQGNGTIPIEGEIRTGLIHIQYLWLDIEKPEVVINPNLSQYLTKQSVSYEIVESRSPHNNGYGNYFDLTSIASSEVITNVRERAYYDSKTEFSIYTYGLKDGNAPEMIVEQLLPYCVGASLAYDWEGTKENGLVMVVTVDQIFNINGKEHNIVSSKHFPVDFSVQPLSDEGYLENNLTYIVNKGKFYEKK